jgi:hypothetical protein
MALADPFNLRLSETHVAFLDEIRDRHSHVTRAAALRHVLDDAMARDRRRLQAAQRRVSQIAQRA